MLNMGMKVVRSGALVALIGVVACAGSADGADATGKSDQAQVEVVELMCLDCFAETSGGGPGSVKEGGGSNGFVGGVAGYASAAGGPRTDNGFGATPPTGGELPGKIGDVSKPIEKEKPTTLHPEGEPCVPSPVLDCVEVHGERREPPSDSEIRVAIQGKEKGERVYVDLPKGKGKPEWVRGSTHTCPHWQAGTPCQLQCAQMGAICSSIFARNPGSQFGQIGSLTGCKSGMPTWTCTYEMAKPGKTCTVIHPLGAVLCDE